MTICPGACNRGYRRADDAYRTAVQVWQQDRARWEAAHEDGTAVGDPPAMPQPHGIVPAAGQPVWCGRCGTGIRRGLLELDDLAAVLAAQVDGNRPPASGQRVSGTAGSPSPEPRLDTLDELIRWAGGWEDTYRGRMGWPARPVASSRARVPRFATVLTRTVSWLAHHLDGLLALDVDESIRFGREVLGWQQRMAEITRTRRDVVFKPVPCPRCGTKQLVLRDADRPSDRRVECQGFVSAERPCGRILLMAEYDQLAEVYDRGLREAKAAVDAEGGAEPVEEASCANSAT